MGSQRIGQGELVFAPTPTKTEPPIETSSTHDYLGDAVATGGSTTSDKTSDRDGSLERRASTLSFVTEAPRYSDTSPEFPPADWKPDQMVRRQGSTASVTFKPRLQHPSLPEPTTKRMSKSRIRDASPPPTRFKNHVSFDNLPIGEATKHNMPALTINVKHNGYKAGRRSRTFMVGVDENAYSDYALQWLLDELVDDGDEVVCVRVVEKEIRFTDGAYLADAQSIMRDIVDKNGSQRALSFVLEYAIGKLHGTFQKLIQIYQPAMLIVGTRGRSLGGLQGLMNTRNSFSKYCLQYSPVPVVVVRPTEKRMKKKSKRANDASRQTYVHMLAANRGKHEADNEASSTYNMEVQISADEEAHQVARALGLPARFDPTIKPYSQSNIRPSRSSGLSSLQTTDELPEVDEEEPPTTAPVSAAASAASESSDTEDEEAEGEFEVVSGQEALDKEKLEQLHKMEVGEAAALRQPVNEDEDSDSEDSQNMSASGATNQPAAQS